MTIQSPTTIMFTARTLLICAVTAFMTSCDNPQLRAKAEAGDARAQHEYANVLMSGDGLMLQDMAAAHKWWRKAANQGYITSQMTLGVRYLDGDGGLEGGVEKDEVEGYAWLSIAAVNDGDQPHGTKQIAIEWRDNAGKRLTPEQKDRALKRAAELQKEIEAHQKSAVK